MKNTLDAAVIFTALNLKDGDEDAVVTAINNLIDKADKADEYKDLLDAKDLELKTVKAETITKEVQDLIAGGKTAKKLTNELATKLEKDYAENPSGLKDLIDTMPAQMLITEQEKDAEKYEGKTFDDLYASEELETVRKQYPDLYEKLRDAKYPNLKQD